MEKELAQAVRDLSLNAITDLTKMLAVSEGRCSSDEFMTLKRAVGRVIGRIQTEILDGICTQYPELNDLK